MTVEHKAADPKLLLKELRRAFGDYIAGEGCSYCRDTERHEEAAARIGKLLRATKYKDGSG